MLTSFSTAVSALRAAVSALSPATLSGTDAMALVDLASEVERLGAATRTLAAARVAQTGEWEASGVHRTPASWLASRTGGTVGAAIEDLRTAARLDGLPATREALASGTLSTAAASAISRAAAADPGAEDALLAAARTVPFARLRERCDQVEAAAVADEDRDERHRRTRYLRRRSDADGAFLIEARLPMIEGAAIWSVLCARADQLQTAARKAGRPEEHEAFRADALVELAGAAPGTRRASVTILIDKDALERGHTVAGETCKVVNAGPITVRTAAAMVAEGAVRAVMTDGADVTRVVSFGRRIPAQVKAALTVRDPVCIVPGCGQSAHLEIDHTPAFHESGRTMLAELDPLCWYHHDLKTRLGFVVGGGPGGWTFTAPARGP